MRKMHKKLQESRSHPEQRPKGLPKITLPSFQTFESKIESCYLIVLFM